MTPDSLRRYRLTLALFIAGLVLSGVTAFPLLAELSLIMNWLGIPDPTHYEALTGVQHWMAFVYHGLSETYARYPFIGYGTDWLAFGHLVIAMFFIGPWRDPMRNTWVLRVGLLTCALVVPLAMIAGSVRGIPVAWRLLDCSFGVLGAVPLLYCLRLVSRSTPQP